MSEAIRAMSEAIGHRNSAPIRSMTGFAMVRRQTPAGELTVSLRAVNHRGLDLHFHQNSEFALFENTMRAILKQNIARGHIEIRMSLGRESEEGLCYNQPLLNRYVDLFRRASEEFQLDGKPDLNTFFTLPGVFEAGRETKSLDKAFESDVAAALTDCVNDLNSFREREGAALCASFDRELLAIEEQTAQIASIRSDASSHFQQKLRDRLNELLGDSTISETRLIEEAALLADRSDIQEELTRLAVHSQETHRFLENGGEIGKRLDFLLQEMNRETNTILSKTSGVGEAGLTITNLALGVKANIERMREQALNLE